MQTEEIQTDASGQWSVQTLGWLMVASWFCASLLSQSLYIAFNGIPYGPEVLIAKMGNLYWVIAAIEVIIWMLVGILVYARVKKVNSDSPLDHVAPAR